MENETGNKLVKKGNKKFQFLFWTVFGVVFMSVLAIATTTVDETSVESVNIDLTSSTSAPTISLYPNNYVDGTGTLNRALLRFYSGPTTGYARPLSIETHIGNTTSQHPNHVTFYSDIVNLSVNSAPRAIEWYWGAPNISNYNNSADGRFRLNRLSTILFQNDWTGYYGNESTRTTGIESNGNSFGLEMDSNNDSTSSTIFKVFNYGNLVGETVSIELQSRAFVRYNGVNGTLDVGATSNKGLDLYTNGSTTARFATNGNLTLLSLKATYTNGEAYICVDNNGAIFAKETACS